MGMHMLMHFRKADTDDVMTKAARDAAAQLEGWAKDGYDSVKARPAMWGAASLGIGALAGGLYALWRNKDKININLYGADALWNWNGKANGRTMAARTRTKQARRAKLKMNGAADAETSRQPAKRTKRTRRARPAAHAAAHE
jgi:hypothetical protein